MLIAYVVRFSVTTAFSHLCRTVVTPHPLFVCGPHNKEQKKALTRKKQQQQTLTNALTFFFFLI